MYTIKFSWATRSGYGPVSRTVDAENEAAARLALANQVREPIIVHQISKGAS